MQGQAIPKPTRPVVGWLGGKLHPDSHLSPGSPGLPALDALPHPPCARLFASPTSGTGVEARGHSLEAAGRPTEVQGALPILVRDVGVGSGHQQLVSAGSVACGTGLVQGGAAPRGAVWPRPPSQQQPQDLRVAPAGRHVQWGGQLLFVRQRPES